MNKKAAIVLGLALIFGAITAVAVNRVLKRGTDRLSQGEREKVVVAVSPISTGQRITSDRVTVEERPKNTLPDGAMTDITKVVDRVSLTEVAIGEAILSSRLAQEGSAAGLSAVIPAGQRAMTVKVDEVIGVAGFVAPGSFVDVVATVTRSGMEAESTSRIILQHVKVLASGKQVENKEGGPVEVRTVTLQVSPDEAEALALASTAGRLQLVMRNSVDENEISTKGVDTAGLFQYQTQSHAASAQSPPRSIAKSKPATKGESNKETVPPSLPTTVEMIMGAQRTTVTFQ